MKKCAKCKREKAGTLFAIDKNKKDGLTSYCKSCKRKYKKAWNRKNKKRVAAYDKSYRKGGRRPRSNNVQRNKEYVREHKNSIGVCQLCSYAVTPILHYHHKDPKNKSFVLSSPGSRSIKLIKEELEKCILICPNCHALEHLNQP